MKYLICVFFIIIVWPASVFAGTWNMGSLEERVSENEQKIATLEREVAELKTKANTKRKCDCANTGYCLCTKENCKCEDCPEHSKKEQRPVRRNGRSFQTYPMGGYSNPRVALMEDGEVKMYLHPSAYSQERIDKWLDGRTNPTYKRERKTYQSYRPAVRFSTSGGNCVGGSCYGY